MGFRDINTKIFEFFLNGVLLDLFHKLLLEHIPIPNILAKRIIPEGIGVYSLGFELFISFSIIHRGPFPFFGLRIRSVVLAPAHLGFGSASDLRVRRSLLDYGGPNSTIEVAVGGALRAGGAPGLPLFGREGFTRDVLAVFEGA